MRRPLLSAALLILLLEPGFALAGPAGEGSGRFPGDPWEKVNRRVYAFNLGVDHYLIRPLSRLTSGLTPNPLGQAIRNFLVNLNEPVVIVNDLLQAKPGRAVESLFRLALNSTLGGLGAIDVAKGLGVPPQVNGFGDTLGRWGVKPGPYMILPVFGPSTPRDLLGTLVDDATLPFQSINYPYRTEVDITLNIVGGLNQRETVAKDLDTLLDGAADPYASLRSSYLQAREAQIRGDKALPVLETIDEDPAAPAPAQMTPAPAEAQAPSAVPDPAADPKPGADPKSPSLDDAVAAVLSGHAALD